VNAQNVNGVLQTALRTVANFYQEMRRLQTIVQKETTTVQERVECLTAFRCTYEHFFYQRLAK
jgi:hypothetical protein